METSFQTRTPPRHRKRPVPQVASLPSELVVMSVVRESDNSCIWTFSRVIVDAGDPSGFMAVGDVSAATNWVAGRQMSLWYADPVSVGDAWMVDPGEITTIFDPPGVIEPQSGVIE